MLLPKEVTGAVCLLNGNVIGELEGKPVPCATESRHSGKKKQIVFSNIPPIKIARTSTSLFHLQMTLIYFKQNFVILT